MPRKTPSGNRRERKKVVIKHKPCRFCIEKETPIDFKATRMLSEFLTDRGKVVSRRVSGNCQFHQNRVVESVKRARHLALLPYTVNHAVRA